MTYELAIVVAACLIAAATDLRARKIPNAIPIAVAIVALAFAIPHGFVPSAIALGIMLAVLVAGTFAFSNGWLGGGDVKLLAAVAGSLGPTEAIAFMAYTAVSGGAIATAIAVAHRRLPAVARSARDVLRPLAVYGTVAIAPDKPIMMPYALAIASGAVLVALSHSVAPYLRLPL